MLWFNERVWPHIFDVVMGMKSRKLECFEWLPSEWYKNMFVFCGLGHYSFEFPKPFS